MKFSHLILVIFLLVLTTNNKSYARKLSQNAEISLLTCSPGDEVYSVYGHSAIRVKDISQDLDLVFNYGIFDFSAPNFLYRFAKGYTDYFLGAYEFSGFVKEYVADRRSIYEQVLNLTQSEEQQLFDFLLWNARPENRVYRYNFFFDNCATRIRDVMIKQADDEILFPVENTHKKTFRDLIKEYHSEMGWLNFGIDLVVAAPADKIASSFDEMFLPDYLMLHFENATIVRENKAIPLIKSSQIIYKAPELKLTKKWVPGPSVAIGILLLVVLVFSVHQFSKRRTTYLMDYILFGTTGFTGVVMLWFVLYSEHPAMAPNYNLLWAIPMNLVFAIIWKIKKWRKVSRYYFPVVSVWYVIFLMVSFFLPQEFHTAFYLLILIVLSRSIINTYNSFKQSKQVMH